MIMHTDSRARERVLYALGEYAADYDTDAILSDLFDLAGSWEVLTIDPDTFWTIVQRHDKSTNPPTHEDARSETWMLFDHPTDEDPSHEANIYPDDHGFVVEWSHTAVGLVSSRRFPTRAGARAWLADGGYTDFTA